ncbi:MAG: prolipoprotein diacylglyceryl transferase [Bacteroidales bacterium]|jgi:prolipoprotein diacylglyceryl transferase|nr:prolipoprotein diacylglyceryl transferase [Bacteroidales bacterium]
MELNYIIWTFDPVAFSIFGLEIRWYGIMFALAFGLGFYILGKMLKREQAPQSIADSLFWYVAIGIFIGARLGHCFFYEPAYYLAHPLKILAVRDGGLASHGAAIGTLIAIWLLSHKKKLSFWYLVDRVVVLVALGGFFVRMGNLFNSEIYGTPTTLAWGFIFADNGETIPKHPTQIYEALSYLMLFAGLFYYYWKKKGHFTKGILFGWFLIGCFGARFIIEFFKEHQEGIDQQLQSIDMGQILSIPFIIAGIAILILARKNKIK